MRRLSKDNTKQYGRQLAKASHAHPLAVLDVLVAQVESYENLIAAVVESLRWLSPLAFDCLSFSLLEHLGAGRARLKDDGLNASHWLQSLAAFTAAIYRRHFGIELRGLLHYLAHALKAGQSTQLLLLTALLKTMALHEHVDELSDEQIDALGGSDALRAASLDLAGAAGTKAVSKKGATRLVSEMMADGLIAR
ncbi:transcription and export-related complex subunit-domain-containing protein [Pavlovales sp. CCMP2436]|nr:transcription and export-related complex subunit-domain-containing protein [Pavlovales sp. CCMP2436]